MDLKKFKEIKDLCKSKGGVLLTKNSIDLKSSSKFKFKCKEGHEWESISYSILKGHWCKKCSNRIVVDKQRGTLEPVFKYIHSKGGKFISGEYKNQKSKLIVECDKGHRWSVNSNSLLSKNSWCRECLGTKKKDIEQMYKLGKGRGGKCLSKEYINDYTKLEWECNEGHVFQSSPNNIKQGKWCPICSSGIYERICRLYFEKIFNQPFVKVRPDWLKNPKTNKNFEIDGFNEELKLGFEHQGRQHYNKNHHFNDGDSIQNDKIKRVLYKNNKVKIIEIPELVLHTKIKDLKDFIYSELKKIKIIPPVPYDSLKISEFDLYTNTKDKKRLEVEKNIISVLNKNRFKHVGFKYNGGRSVEVKCNMNHIFSIPEQKVIKNLIVCPSCKREELKKKILSNGSSILNGEILNGNSIVEIKCVNSHFYKSSVSNIIRRGCSECTKMNKLNIDSLVSTIHNNGGIIILKKYEGGKYHFKIKCKSNHTFETNNILIKNGKWCPDCNLLNKKQKLNDRFEKLLNHLKTINGVCLVSTPNSDNKLKFKCQNNHIFYSTLNNVIYGYWCRKCFSLKQSSNIPKNRKTLILDYMKSKNGSFILEPITFHYKEIVKVRCRRGHAWETTIQNLKENQWCRKCGLLDRWETSKISIQDINNIIKERGGKCMSKVYKNSYNDKLIFKCDKGHKWESIWNNVRRGSWCPICSNNIRKK